MVGALAEVMALPTLEVATGEGCCCCCCWLVCGFFWMVITGVWVGVAVLSATSLANVPTAAAAAVGLAAPLLMEFFSDCIMLV